MPDAVTIPSTSWIGGVNSLVDPLFLPNNQVQWSFNAINRGGLYSTRPGYRTLIDTAVRSYEARGMTLFQPSSGDIYLVKAIGSGLRVAQPPFTNWVSLPKIAFDPSDDPAFFSTGIKGATTLSNGTLTFPDPKTVLLVQTGNNPAYMWDGTKATTLTGAPIGTINIWAGNRWWVASGNKLYASNLDAPDQFLNDGSTLNGAGYFNLPGEITGMGVTADQNSLLVFTHDSTTAFQITVPRADWFTTAGFQKVILPNIGCVAPKTVVNQYGMLWWMSQGGLMGLDDALQSYRSSRIHFKDQEMSRSKENLSPDVSRMCAGAYENFLVISVPSGHLYNAHTWVMDQGIVDSITSGSAPAWASCWTGTLPVEWVTGVINGNSRCFHLSRSSYSSVGNGPIADVVESFCDLRKDIIYDITNVMRPLEIKSSMETKYLSGTGQLKFGWVELMLTGLARNSNIKVSYASRHSGYKEVLTKNMVATIDELNDLHKFPMVNGLVRQVRRIRTSTDEYSPGDKNSKIEDEYTRNLDRGFFLLIEWTGELSIESLYLYAYPMNDKVDGRAEVDEVYSQYVEVDGTGVITADLPQLPSILATKSSTPTGVYPRSSEMSYIVS